MPTFLRPLFVSTGSFAHLCGLLRNVVSDAQFAPWRCSLDESLPVDALNILEDEHRLTLSSSVTQLVHVRLLFAAVLEA